MALDLMRWVWIWWRSRSAEQCYRRASTAAALRATFGDDVGGGDDRAVRGANRESVDGEDEGSCRGDCRRSWWLSRRKNSVRDEGACWC